MLSRSTRLGIAAMSALASASDTQKPALTALEIARLRRIPQPYLAKILAALSHHNLICGTRGRGGGYVLARSPEQIPIRDIAACFERLEPAPRCPLGRLKVCDRQHRCPLHVPFQKMWGAQTAFLAETTLEGFEQLSHSPGEPPARKPSLGGRLSGRRQRASATKAM